MAEELSAADIDAVRDLLANSSLASIENYELSALREQVDQPEGAADVSIAVQQRADDTSFGIRLNAEVTLSEGSIRASVAGEYLLSNGHQPSARALKVFANEVAVMAVFPFLREAVASISARVFGRQLILPTVERGQIALDLEDE